MLGRDTMNVAGTGVSKRVYERLERGFDHPFSVDQDDCNFDNPVSSVGIEAGSLEVDDRQVGGERNGRASHVTTLESSFSSRKCALPFGYL